MNLFLLIMLVVILLIILLFLEAMRIKLVFNSDKSELSMKLFWLGSFINAFVTIENNAPVLKLYLFNKLVLTKSINRANSKQGGMELLKITDPKDVHVNVYYGFNDPITTGIACGAINVVSQFINIDSISHTPDFMPANDYICLDATAKVNIGSTIVRYFKLKKH